jgi:hypothetical protein
VKFVSTKKVGQQIPPPPLFFAVVGSEIGDLRWKKMRIQDKPPGSATLAKKACPVRYRGTVKCPKFGNGPYLRHLFSDDIFPGIKVFDTISKSKRLLLLSSSLWNFVLKYSNVIF